MARPRRRSNEELQELVLGLVQDAEDRRQVDDLMDRLYHNEHTIYFPKDYESPRKVYSGLVASQIDLLMGMVARRRPRVRLAVSTESTTLLALAEQTEQAINAVWPLLAEQGGEDPWYLATFDQLLFGRGWTRFEWLSSRWDEEMPRPEDFEEGPDGAAAYRQARRRAVQRMGVPQGRLPFLWSHAPARNVFWEQDPESGLRLVVELRVRRLSTVLRHPLYQRSLPTIREKWTRLKESDARAAERQQVYFAIVEDGAYTYYLVLGYDDLLNAVVTPADAQRERTSAAPGAQVEVHAALADYRQGELAATVPNPLGRPRYAFLPGMVDASRGWTRRYQSACEKIALLVIVIDHLLSWRVARQRDFAFPIPVLTRAPVPQNGVPVFASEGPDGAERPLVIDRSGTKAVELSPGETLDFLLNPGGGPEEQAIADQLQRYVSLLGVPDALYDSKTASGYLYESLVNTLQARNNPIVLGQRWGHRQLVSLFLDTVRWARTPFEILSSSPGVE